MSSPIVVQGTIVDASNNPATSGYVEFALSPLNQGLAYQVRPLQVIAAVSRGVINSSGQLKGPDGVSDCLVWPNDVIEPSNTLYTITIAPNNEVTRIYNNVLLKSIVDPQSLAELTFILPQPVIGTVIEGSPLVTESVIPAVDNVFTLGDPAHRYAHVYANVLDDSLVNLTVDQLHVTGFIDNPDLGEPVRIQDDLTITQCLTFETDAGVHTDELCPATGANFTHQLPATNGTLAPLDSPVFIGTPQAPTPLISDNSNKLATTAFVQLFVAPSSPVTSVFGRIGAIVALTGDYTVGQVTGAAPLASPVLTGDPQAPTPGTSDNDTSIATTAFVNALLSSAGAFGGGGFAISKTTNGYIKLPSALGGLIIQWLTGGNDPASEAATTKNFPIAFPTACLNVSVSMKGPSTNANDSWYQVVSFNTTSVTLFKQGSGGTEQITQALVIAIGY